MNLFGSRKPKPDAKETMLKLCDTIDTLEKKITFLQSKADGHLSLAKRNATCDKQAALRHLQRKRQCLDQIDKLAGMQFNMEQQKLALDNAQAMKEVVSVMATTAQVLSDLNKPKDIDNVEKILDNVMEQADQVEHVSEILSRPMTTGSYVDEDELAAELEMLEQQDIDQRMLETCSVPLQINTPSITAPAVTVASSAATITAPAVPTHVPRPAPAAAIITAPAMQSVAADDDDDDIAQLKAAMLLN